jgi:homocysteine S-methyltransferase
MKCTLYITAIATAPDCNAYIDTPTWRANADHMYRLKYTLDDVERINRVASEWMIKFRSEVTKTLGHRRNWIVGGQVGPRGDGYVTTKDNQMSPNTSAEYHAPNVRGLKAGGVDVITAQTMTYPAEALGVVIAAGRVGLPCVIYFTIETDGHLPDSSTISEAISVLESANTYGVVRPLFYGINCAHPSHISKCLSQAGDVVSRIRAIRVNASRLSHAELDQAKELDTGDPVELGMECATLLRHYGLHVIGGCCGTDERHIHQIGWQITQSTPTLDCCNKIPALSDNNI